MLVILLPPSPIPPNKTDPNYWLAAVFMTENTTFNTPVASVQIPIYA